MGVTQAALPTIPAPPGLPDFGMHKICDFLNFFTRSLSGYYGPSGAPAASAAPASPFLICM